MMRTSRNGNTPAYKKIQNVIRKRIEGGHLKIGDAVDSERELARIHNVTTADAKRRSRYRPMEPPSWD